MQEDTYQGDGLNLYAYCKNNPVVYYDPSGYSQEPKCVEEGLGEDDGGNEGGSNTINPQLINSQSELSKEYFNTLQSNGTLKSGGRSGGTVPQTAPANSYYITERGHVVIYGQDGNRVMDISSERIKIYKFNQNPNNPNLGNWSDRKLKDSNGMIDKTAQWILDYFGIK